MLPGDQLRAAEVHENFAQLGGTKVINCPMTCEHFVPEAELQESFPALFVEFAKYWETSRVTKGLMKAEQDELAMGREVVEAVFVLLVGEENNGISPIPILIDGGFGVQFVIYLEVHDVVNVTLTKHRHVGYSLLREFSDIFLVDRPPRSLGEIGL